MPSDNTSQQSLTVALRVRPINMMEVGQDARYIAHVIDKQLVVLQDPSDATDDILRQNRSRQKEYLFDCALGPQTSQAEVYEATTRCLIDSVLTGYNATVFAYGPTGTGKTYTMLGTDSDPGIMVLTLNDLFKRMEEDQHVMKYRATIAYLEVYNEMICDLLQPSSGFLDLREDSKGNVVVAGLLEVETSSTIEVMRLLKVGNERRSCEPTAVNMTSSRSHAVLQVTVEASRLAVGAQQEVQTGRLYMVDLAGSERAAQTQNRGRRMVEGAHINRSLLALGNCINALVGNNKNHYVNYRDSKLTRLLKEALGGNCRTVMIAHVSPASTSFEESRNTLGYADRAKHIKTKVRQNTTDVDYHILQYTAVIADLQQEIARLRTKCIEPSSSLLHGSAADEHPDNRSVTEFAHISSELKDVLKKQESLRQELQSKDELLLQNSADIQRHKSFELERPESRNTGSHYSLNDTIANTASSTEVTLLSTNQHGKPRNSFSSPLDSYKPQDGSVSPDGATMTMLSIPGASGWCGEEALKELSLLYREREQLQEQQKSILERLDHAQSKAVDLKDRLTEYITTDSQNDIFTYLTKINELESDNIQQVRSMSHVRNGILHVRHMLEQLVQQNRQCMKLVERQRSLIKGHFSDCLLSVEEQYKQLVEQQQLLSIRLSSSHLQLHPLLDSTKHGSSTTEGELLKARLLEADSQCGEESMPQLPVLPGITSADNSSKILKKMDTVTSLPSLEAKTGQSDDSMIRSHSELCLQNGNGNNQVKSTALSKISKDSGKTLQPKLSTATTYSYNLAPVRPSNGKALNTKPFPFVHSPPATLQPDYNNSHNRNFNSSSQSKNSMRGHLEVKKGVVMDTKVPSSMRKKLLNQNTRRHAMNMAEASVSISKPVEPHHRRKTAAKREPMKKIPLPIKAEVKDFSIITSSLVASQKPQPITPPDASHTSKLPRAIPNGAPRPPRASGKPLSVTGTGISTNKT